MTRSGDRLVLPLMVESQRQAWDALLSLGASHVPWRLVGGQLVHLHCWERGVDPPRATTDADTLVDVRVHPSALRDATALLHELGFHEDGVSPDLIGHRWVKDEASIDLLVPDGTRAAAYSTVTSARTIAAPGGTQALHRAERVAVRLGGRDGEVVRPTLLGALLLKIGAWTADHRPGRQRHLEDFAVLAGLASAQEWAAMRADVSKKERRKLASGLGLLPTTHHAWDAVADADIVRAQLERLVE